MKKITDNILFDYSDFQIKPYHFVKKNWGAEFWITNSQLYCMKILLIERDKMCSIHYHNEKDETFHIVDGYVCIELWNNINKPYFDENKPDNRMLFWPGSSIHIPPKIPHRFLGKKPSSIIEVSTHHKDDDSIRLVNSPFYGDIK